MDGDKLWANRQSFIEWSGEIIMASARGGIFVVTNWKTFLIMQLMNSLLPNERPTLAKYTPLIIRVLLELQITGKGGLANLTDPIYLWACGYGSREKALFTIAMAGFPVLANATGAYFACSIYEVLDWLGFKNIVLRFLCLPLGALVVSNMLAFFGTLFSRFFVRRMTPPLVGYNLTYLLFYQLACIVDSEIYSNRQVLWQYHHFLTRAEVEIGLEEGQKRQEGLNSFEYSRLGRREIRLLQLLPEPRVGRRRYRLVKAPLEAVVGQYNAISYVWGSDNRTHGLPINDTWLQTTESTFEILNHRVPEWTNDLTTKWWIDFVSINQDDEEERGEQVSIMDEIYRGAKTVVAFLKPPNPDDSDIARHFLYSLESDVVNQRRRIYGLPFLNMNSNKIMPILAGMLSESTGKSPSPGWQALSDLIGHAYWTRIWVLQEIILSRNFIIYYGEHRVDWIELGKFVRLEGTEERYVDWDVANLVSRDSINKSRFRIRFTTQFKARHNDRMRLDLREIMSVVPRMGAGDARDRFFGLIGLLPRDLVRNKLPLSLNPNYATATAEDVYIAFAEYIWQERDPEWLLSMAGIGYSKPKGFKPRCESCARHLTELPSWVPDWRIPHPIPLPRMRDFDERDSFPNAASNREKLSVRLEDNKPSILTSKVGTVQSVLQISDIFVTVTMANAGEHTEKFLWAWRRLLRAMIVFRYMYSDRIETLGRVFTAGLGDSHCFRSIYQVMERHRALFDSLQVGVNPLAHLKTKILAMYWDLEKVLASEKVRTWYKWVDVCDLRALAITLEGGFALVPQYTVAGDEIRAFDGMESCFVTRNKGNEVFLVGDCYVDGFDVSDYAKYWVTRTIS